MPVSPHLLKRGDGPHATQSVLILHIFSHPQPSQISATLSRRPYQRFESHTILQHTLLLVYHG